MADWANNGNFVTTPPAAAIDQGFNPQQPLVAGWLNWLLNRLDALYNTAFPAEHNASTGAHTNVTATKVTVQEGASGEGIHYADNGHLVEIEMSPQLGGWTVVGHEADIVLKSDGPAGTYVLAKATYNPGLLFVTTDPAAAAVARTAILRSPAIRLSDLVAGDNIFTLTDIQISMRNPASDEPPDNAALSLVQKNGSTYTVVWQRDLFGTPSGSSDAVTGLTLALDSEEALYVEYYSDVADATAPARWDVPLSIILQLQRKRIL